MITLAYPWILLALPLLWLSWLGSRRILRHRLLRSTEPALLHPQAELLAALMQDHSATRKQPWLLLLACAVLLLALAQPRWVNPADMAAQNGRDIMLALDVSGSMRALDFADKDGAPISRLAMLKQVVGEFLAKRGGDRVGIIVFGDDAFTLAPLTSDLHVLGRMLNSIDSGIAGEKTALGTAIALGVKRLDYKVVQSRALIIFTDGSNTTGMEPTLALELAKQNRVRIYTVAIGREGKVAFPRGTLESPAYTEMPVDESLLRQIAQETGGKFYHAATNQDFSDIFSQIDQLSAAPIKIPNNYAYKDAYHAPLLLGLLLLLWHRWRIAHAVFP